jgi:hypothetical protein
MIRSDGAVFFFNPKLKHYIDEEQAEDAKFSILVARVTTDALNAAKKEY